ncbi:MAG: tetratricopeptide repeat protein [Isosphaeraceae bacterium]
MAPGSHPAYNKGMDTASPLPLVVETTEATFERDVIDRSRDLPVVVDFWAAWCGPCQRLGPILERLATEYAGKFALVKVDTELCPNLATGFGVRSLPTVMAVKDGQVVDGFLGAQGEAEVRMFLDRIMPTERENLVAEARHLEASDPSAAAEKYRAALAQLPHDEKAMTGLARVLTASGKNAEAEEVLANLERRGPLNDEAARVKAQLVLQEGAEEAGDVAGCRSAVAADPTDRTLQFRLAEALAADGQYPEALETCLTLVEEDRRGTGEEARRLMLAIFSLLPDDSELSSEYRRKLSFAL